MASSQALLASSTGKAQLNGRLKLSDGERGALGEIGHRLGRSVEVSVMIDRVANRDQAVEALTALILREAGKINGLSHFRRFLEIYKEFEVKVKDWRPTHAVPVNPQTMSDPYYSRYHNHTLISAKHAQEWASLFNLRYCLLLRYLAHTFHLASAELPNLRAMVKRLVFGEMYNLKTIAGILVRLPLRDGDNARAGPAFEMPYTLQLGHTDLDIWTNHRDLIGNAQRICVTLRESGAGNEAYLSALLDLDSQARISIERIIAGRSCFISYSSKDNDFAEKLRLDLEQAGVRCWFAPHDLPIGAKIRPAIDNAIHEHSRVILIPLPVTLDSAIRDVRDGWAAEIRRQRNIGDFTSWKDAPSYASALTRLLKSL